MNILVSLVAAFMTAIGLLGLVRPAALSRFVLVWRSPAGLWTATAIRLLFAVALWLAAPASRLPLVLEVLAVVVLMAGLTLPVLGPARFVAILDWWLRLPESRRRAWLAPTAALGVFLLWAVNG